MYFDINDQSQEELNKKRIEREKAKQKILEKMREHQIIKREYEIAEQQEAEEKQNQEETQKELEIVNLRWEHTEQDITDQRPDYVSFGDKIKLLADVKNGDGKKSTFEVHDLNISRSIDPEQLVVDKSSKVEAEATSVEWKVSDPRSKKNSDREIDLYFLVKVDDAFSENCEIMVKDSIKIIKGGATVHITGEGSDLLENVDIVLKANNEELYTGTLPDGILEIKDIGKLEMTIECTYNGNSITHPVEWYVGDSPYPIQIIELHIEEKED